MGASRIRTAEDLASAASVHNATARWWLLAKQAPELGPLLRLATHFGLGMTKFLGGSLPSTPVKKPGSGGSARSPLPRRFTRRLFDEETIRPVLQAALDTDGATCPPTPKELCRQHGWTFCTVYRHLPHLCQSLSAERAAHRKINRQQRMDAIHEEVRQATLQVHREGRPVTSSNVGAALKQGGLMRSPWARAAFKETRQKLHSSPRC